VLPPYPGPGTPFPYFLIYFFFLISIFNPEHSESTFL
jgi:hypothetical protein